MTIKLAMELIFSAQEKGGGTFHHNGLEIDADWYPFSDAYVVGGKTDSLVMRLPRGRGIIEATERVAKWLDKNISRYYGSWSEGEALYIDAVDIFDDYQLAILNGKRRNQISIYDLKKGEVIYLEQEESEGGSDRKER